MTDHQWQQAFDAGRAEAEGCLGDTLDALIAAIEFEAYPIMDGVNVAMRCGILLKCADEARTALAKYREGK